MKQSSQPKPATARDGVVAELRAQVRQLQEERDALQEELRRERAESRFRGMAGAK